MDIEDEWMEAEPGLAPMPGRYGGERAGEGDERLHFSDVGKLGRRARRRLVRTARLEDRPTFPKLLADHLSTDLDHVEVVEESWPAYDLVNVQVGLEAFLGQDGVAHGLVGMRDHRHREFGLTDLLRPSEHEGCGPHPGNVAWTQLACGPNGEVTPAALAAIYLVTVRARFGRRPVDEPTRLAFMLRAADPELGMGQRGAPAHRRRPAGAAVAAASEIRRLAVEHNVFRGQVISFEHDMFGERASALQFHRRPGDCRRGDSAGRDACDDPPPGGRGRRAPRAAARRRQHLKRGLLLYGPPGVGKTHTVAS